MQIKNPQYFGKILHEKGFRVWTLYMFQHIEGRKFIEEKLHDGLFQAFQDVYNGKESRININVPPRSGKTSLAKYFEAYSFAGNARCNFIYTSFSQDLLNDISRSLAGILQHPIYEAMYGISSVEESIDAKPIDDFWKEYLQEDMGKASYSSRKIITAKGGIALFASIGSAITGFGAGIRGSKIFSGALMIDDANKPADIRSQTMREKVKSYYEETLLSRLNDSNVPIVNIQQRLHLEDLSGFLQKIYGFRTLKRPLIEDGICQLPSQYTEERIAEVQKNEFMFAGQYQQEPVLEGGNLFKLETIRELSRDSMPKRYDWRFIVADLASKDKEKNDWTVFSYWGIKSEVVNDRVRNHLYLDDVKRKKINAVDIEKWIDSWVKDKISYGFRYIWIEDKSHGIYLNQLYRNKGLPVPTEEMLKEVLPRDKDKVERANNIIPCLDTIVPNLTFCKDVEDYEELKQEFLAFPDVKHDDFTDTVIDAVKIGLFTDDVVAKWQQYIS